MKYSMTGSKINRTLRWYRTKAFKKILQRHNELMKESKSLLLKRGQRWVKVNGIL